MTHKRLDIQFGISSIVMLILMLICVFNLRPRIIYQVYNDSSAKIVNVIGNNKSYIIDDTYNNHIVDKIEARAFYDKYYIEDVKLSQNVKSISRLAFSKCKNLKTINLENVESIDRNAFSYCDNLNNIDVSNVKIINSSTFFKCYSLSDIKLDSAKSIYSLSFAYTSIETLDLPSLTYAAPESFYYMDELKTINVYNSTIYTYLTLNYDSIFNKEGINIVLNEI